LLSNQPRQAYSRAIPLKSFSAKSDLRAVFVREGSAEIHIAQDAPGRVQIGSVQLNSSTGKGKSNASTATEGVIHKPAEVMDKGQFGIIAAELAAALIGARQPLGLRRINSVTAAASEMHILADGSVIKRAHAPMRRI